MPKSITSPDSSHPHIRIIRDEEPATYDADHTDPKPTFRQIPDAVLALGDPFATHLYGIMLWRARSNKYVRASWSDLADWSGISRRKVGYTLAALTETGFIAVDHQSRNGKRATNLITFCTPKNQVHDMHRSSAPDAPTSALNAPPSAPDALELNGYVLTDTSNGYVGGNACATPPPAERIEESPEEPMGEKRATRIPENFTLSDAWRDAAIKIGIDYDVDWQFEAFVDNSLAKGLTYKDWTAAWRTWCRNAVSWQKRGPRTTTYVPDRVAEAKAEKERLLAGQWVGQREALMYAPKSDGPQNVARRIAELDRIITGQVAA